MDFNVTLESSYPTPYANSSLLWPLLLSLASQKHTPTTTTAFRDEYDYIIVGAGAAGSALAARLSEKPSVSVLLLEAGVSPPLLTDVPAFAVYFEKSNLDWQFFTTPQKHAAMQAKEKKVRMQAGKGVGGSSIINEMLFVRGNKYNYDDWVDMGAEGWSYKDVLPYFLRMENNTDPQYLKSAYHSNKGPMIYGRPDYDGFRTAVKESAEQYSYRYGDVNAEIQTGFYNFQMNIRNGQRCSVPKAYLVPANDRINLDIVAEAFVTKITIENKQARGVIFDFKGQTYEVKAKREVILSAGSVNTPKLLMLSGIGPERVLQKHKISLVANLAVGQNLMDHCASFMNFISDQSIKVLNEKVSDPKYAEEYIQTKTGPLTSSSDMAGPAFLQGSHVNPKVDFPNYQIYFFKFDASSFSEYFRLQGKVSRKFFKPLKKGQSFVSCVSQVLQPKSRGTVTLNSTDPYDPPLINPNYLEKSSDVEDIVQGLKICKKIFTSSAFRNLGFRDYNKKLPGCKKLHGDDYLRCQTRSATVSLHHPTGTAKMGDRNDPTTVVDPQLRVKGIKGLRVVDASVMPILTSGNTMTPVLMIAEKAADIIKETIEDC